MVLRNQQGCKAMFDTPQYHPIAMDALTHDAINDELKTLFVHDCGEDYIEGKTPKPLPEDIAPLALRSNTESTVKLRGRDYQRTVKHFNKIEPFDIVLHPIDRDGKRDTTVAILLRDPTRESFNDRYAKWTLSLRWTGQTCSNHRPVAIECYRDQFKELFHGQIDESDIYLQRVDYCINTINNRPITQSDYGFNTSLHYQHPENYTNVATQLTCADPRGSWGGASSDSNTKYLAGLRIRIYDSGGKDPLRCLHPAIPLNLRFVLHQAYADAITKPFNPDRLQTRLSLNRIEVQLNQSWLRHYDCYRLSDYITERHCLIATAFKKLRIIDRRQANKSRCEDAEWWATAMAGIRQHATLNRIPRRSKIQDVSDSNARLAGVLAQRYANRFNHDKEPPPATGRAAIRQLSLSEDDLDDIDAHYSRLLINRLERDRQTEIDIDAHRKRVELYVATDESFYEDRPTPEQYQALIDILSKSPLIPSNGICIPRVTDVGFQRNRRNTCINWEPPDTAEVT